MTANKKLPALLAGLAMGLLLGGCVALQENIGKAVGTTVGAGLGLTSCIKLGGSDAECAAATVAGGIVGYSLGKLYDERRKRLAAAAEGTDADIEFETVKVSTAVASADSSTGSGSSGASATTKVSEGLVASVRQDEMFVVGSSRPSDSALDTFSRLASVYAEQFALNDGTKVDTQLLIVGHADATGSAVRNQVLSERRATAIATIFNESGLPADRLFVSGAGSSQPVADNETTLGRQQNRRVEIVEISDEQGLVSFSDLRKSDPRFLQHSTRNPGQGVVVKNSPGDAAETSGNEAIRRSEALIDFAGTPANESDTSVLTAIVSDSEQGGLLSKLLPANSGYQAADSGQPLVPCVADSPRISGSVVAFDSKQSVSAPNSADQFMPGMNKRAWQSMVNGHLVSVSPVSVLEPSGQPANSPVVFIYENHSEASDKPSATVETLVETYMSGSGILYRVYSLEAGTGIYCADIALPLTAPHVAMGGKLYYKDGSALYEQGFQPSAVSLE